MIILDTNVMVAILRKTPRGTIWQKFLLDKSISLTSITTFELFLGAELSKKREHNLDIVQKLVQKLPILPLTVKSSFIASKIYSTLQKLGKILEINDIYIGAITLEHNAMIATDNKEHFGRIENIRIIEPL